MQTAGLTAPNGGFNKTTTFVSGVDDDGQPHEYGCLYGTFRANAAIAKGDLVSWVNPTASVPVSVTPMPTAATDLDFVGVALEACAAGKYVRVGVLGFVLVDMAAQTSAAGEYLINPTTTAGKGIRAAAPTFDAALITGSVLGRVFGVKNATTNLALCFIKQF
jgi:hypothetical protein